MDNPTNPLTAEPAPTDCPVVGCVGLDADHTFANPAENLHTQPGKPLEIPATVEWPLDVTLTMDSKSYPHWRILLETWAEGEDLTAEQAGLLGLDITMNALHVAELNRAIDAAA
ncbi:MAG: hypothetical protein JWQ47_2287 [Glaciihabitans sp.]|nr:hypothetical protein [Glaciihabitans sp.]